MSDGYGAVGDARKRITEYDRTGDAERALARAVAEAREKALADVDAVLRDVNFANWVACIASEETAYVHDLLVDVANELPDALELRRGESHE